MESNLIWIDLSTFDVEKASGFYKSVFSWNFFEDETGYHLCSFKNEPCAGIYQMPERFKQIRMPSFWMTYILVDDAEAIADKAKELGGTVELVEENDKGKIALIRDPSGAGFTCYQGKALAAERNFAQTGKWCWSELLVSQISLVKGFNESLFAWKIEVESPDRYAIHTEGGDEIGAIQVATEQEKGDKEFWAVYFAVDDLSQAQTQIEQAGGQVVGIYPHEKGTQMLAYDDQDAAFFLIQAQHKNELTMTSKPSNQQPTSLKWRSIFGLIGIYLIILFEQTWGWGLLFLFWVIPDLKSGTTYFIEPLSRRENPILYWLVVLTWIILSAYLLVIPLL